MTSDLPGDPARDRPGRPALIAEHGYSKQPAAVRHAIERSALDLGPTGTDPYYGRGRNDVARALGL